MVLKLILDEQILELNVPEALIARAQDFFAKMDRDMDRGWQIGRDWIEAPSRLQRCQVAADKLVTALETENHDLGRLMAGYILDRAPEIEAIEPDVHGEPQNTQFHFRDPGAAETSAAPAPPPSATTPSPVDKMAALALAGKQVSKAFRAGRHWKFSVLDQGSGEWEESPAVATREEAERLREAALHRRFRELCGEG